MLTEKERRRRDKLERTPPDRYWSRYSYLGMPLSARQQQALEVLIDNPNGKTYKQAASEMGISEGTLHSYLSIARRKQPDLYKQMMKTRQQQLKRRHARSLERTRQRKHEWYMQRRYTKVERFLKKVEALRQLRELT